MRFEKAKPRFLEVQLKDAKQVISDDDYVAHVEIATPRGKLNSRLLIKIKEGKPYLVGIGVERLD